MKFLLYKCNKKKRRKIFSFLPNLGLSLIFLLMSINLMAAGKELRVTNAAEFREALNLAEPGTTILLAPGNYGNQFTVTSLYGTPEKPITIAGADKQNKPLFEGGAQALHFRACRYITVRDLDVTGSTGNGINSDHGGSHETTSVGMVFENITIQNVGPTGNRDALKLSGLRKFTVRNCTFSGWGGSGIDMVGCRDGVIENCRFIGKEGFSQDNAVQAKGGSERIIVRQNFFHNAGQRAVNIGGSTGLQFFRSDDIDYEAKDIEVAGNVFVGGITPVAFVTAVNNKFHYNTIVDPEKWIMRILQEMPVSRFQPSNNGTFENNLVVYSRGIQSFANISPDTKPETFVFQGNVWYCSDGTRQPDLPVDEINGVYQVDPQIKLSEMGEVMVQSNDPRIQKVGAHAYLTRENKYQNGIAAMYPADNDIENHPSVVFTENFEAETIEEVLLNWTWSRGTEDHRVTLVSTPGPDGKTNNKSLKMTILRDKEGDGSDLRKIFDEGYEKLYFRFYVMFAEDFGFNHHFTSISGDLNPTPWAKGGAGLRPDDRFSSTIDQSLKNASLTGPDHTPPGYWFFYSYWPEMRSWQSPEGKPDGRPNPYYGNSFMPNKPIPAIRGKWQCVEIMIRLNSAPDIADGAQAFWIDGELAGSWDPLEENPVKGYWNGMVFRSDPNHEDAQPFTGIKWRTLQNREQFERLKINIIRLQNYVSGGTFEQADKYAKEHPGFKINLKEATVWKDNIVVATEYIGPIETLKQ